MIRSAFFRHTGWMLLAAGLGGVFTFLVQPILTRPLAPFLKNPITREEFGLYFALVALVSLLNTWSSGLQSTIAHQTALVVSPEQERELRGIVRKILAVLFGVWVLALVLTFSLESKLMKDFKVYHPASLWVTMLIGLPVLWQPVLSGILQGKENFLWLGWQSILNGLGRCLAILIIVRLMGVHVTGAMAGVFVGSATSLAISFWQSLPVLRGPAEPVALGAWLRRVTPLVFGLASAGFMLGADVIVVRRMFAADQSGLYSAVAIIGRALMFFVIPMTQVMFPKVVQAAAKSGATDAMTHALAATAFIGAVAALGCTILPELPLRILFPPAYLEVKTLVWVYAWCMIPVTLANVLINNLMARQHYHSVPWLVTVAVGYGISLFVVANRMQTAASLDAFRAIVLTFGVFSVLMLAITIWFTVKRR